MKPEAARSLLFVPGNRADRFGKAAASGADLVLCDLEDAVAPPDKESARAEVAAWAAGHPAAVRINAADTPWYDDDLAVLAEAPGLAAVVLPKADSIPALRATIARLPDGVALFALLESARGVRDADQIAELPGVTRLVFGNVDFGLDTGVTVTDAAERELLYARSRLVVASRAAGLAAPVDGVTTDLYDVALTRDAARAARNLGFGGKLCLHPKQVDAVNAAFSPDEEELRWARRVLEAAEESGGAAVRVDGEMIDKPRVELARRLLGGFGGE
ncbi:HpcH/HpaI aldolase/citrate lyase family protein [Amycolatopsis anabasis]|uniref:HpcH/HpaI aldolase/citrate lyase family protein n=1 Tax=Amycolatopsis anabasis TaxID=1840409 RepID=UPI001C555E37|nr:CoA ester lyase [Amycolatopsis anabasis]